MNKKIGLVINYHYFVIIAMVMFMCMCMFMIIPPIFLSWLADDIYNSR
jgi:hypothetical protein